MAKTKEQRLADVHRIALKEFDATVAACRDERQQCLEDRRFYSISGSQWEGSLSDNYENKPKFEVNKVHLALIRIISEYRNNRVTVDFKPKDGSENDELADSCDGLYRASEQESNAEEAYDNAFEEAVGGGVGAWRYRAVFEDEEDDTNDQQVPIIEPIYDADSRVFWDAGSRRQDHSDARRCWVLTPYTPDDYRETWNDEPDGWTHDISDTEFDWATSDVVYVAEYYVVEKKTIRQFTYQPQIQDDEPLLVTSEDLANDPELENELLATGHKLIDEKRRSRRVVRKYVLSGGGVLEDSGIIAGRHIPVVMTYGKRWFVDGIERCMGHVRLVKDAQRLKNMLISLLAEIAVRSPVEKPIFTPEQMSGHTVEWSQDSVEDYPYLLINPILDGEGNPMASGPVGYTKPPSVPPALATLLQITEQDIQDLLGNQQGGDQVVSNIAARAVELIQQRLDMQSFIYMSNFAKAVKRGGEIWLSMARELLVEPDRKLRAVGKQGEVDQVIIAQRVLDDDGAETIKNDLTGANFNVYTDVGPSSTSRRESTVRTLTELRATASDPEDQKILQSLIMLNVEGEGITDARDYYRKRLVGMGVLEPTEDEQQAMTEAQQGRGPDANEQLILATAQSELSDAKKKQADVELTMAKVKETEAKTLKLLQGD